MAAIAEQGSGEAGSARFPPAFPQQGCGQAAAPPAAPGPASSAIPGAGSARGEPPLARGARSASSQLGLLLLLPRNWFWLC